MYGNDNSRSDLGHISKVVCVNVTWFTASNDGVVMLFILGCNLEAVSLTRLIFSSFIPDIVHAR